MPMILRMRWNAADIRFIAQIEREQNILIEAEAYFRDGAAA